MTKYMYHVVTIDPAPEEVDENTNLEIVLNDLGDWGWDLVSIERYGFGFNVVMKRPVQE